MNRSVGVKGQPDSSEDMNGNQKGTFNSCFWLGLSIYLQRCLVRGVLSPEQMSGVTFPCLISQPFKTQTKHQRYGRCCRAAPSNI